MIANTCFSTLFLSFLKWVSNDIQEREKELQRQEKIERALIEELEEKQMRRKTEDELLKEKREKRLQEVTDKARRDRERSASR